MGQFTKKAIRETFMKLLNEKAFDKISVKDIVEDCGINRNTFYYYYHDIYALLEDIFETEIDGVVKDNNILESWQEGLIQSTEFALQNKRAIFHVYHSINREQLERYFYKIAEYLMLKFVKQQAAGLSIPEADMHLIAAFYKHAVVGIMFEWLDRGMKEEPEHIIRRIGYLFEGNIYNSLLRAAEDHKGR